MEILSIFSLSVFWMLWRVFSPSSRFSSLGLVWSRRQILFPPAWSSQKGQVQTLSPSMLRLVHTHLSSPASSLTSLRLCCLELFLPSIDFLVILFPWEAPLLLELTASFRAMLPTIPKHVRCPVYNICSLLPSAPGSALWEHVLKS